MSEMMQLWYFRVVPLLNTNAEYNHPVAIVHTHITYSPHKELEMLAKYRTLKVNIKAPQKHLYILATQKK